MTPLRRLIHVKSDERVRTLVLFLQYFFVVAVSIAGKSARDTYFLSRYDRELLPLMFAACAIAVAASAALYSRLARRLSSRALHTAVNFVFVAGIVILQFRLEGYAIPLLYIWVELSVAILSLAFWLSASEVFDPRQAKRLFGIIGGGGGLAAILAGSAVKPCSQAFGSESLLWLVVAGLGAHWAIGSYAQRFLVSKSPARPQPAQPVGKQRFDSYLVFIAAVTALTALASQVVDYQFKIFAAQAISDEASLAGYFGHFYAAAGIVTLVVQFFLTSALLSRFGVLVGLLSLPMFLNLGAVMVLIHPVLASAAIGKFSDQTLKFTLNNSALELLWLPVPSLRRKSVRPIVSGTVKYVAESTAGLCIFFLVDFLGLRYLSLVTVATVAVWAVIATRLKSLYVKALVSALEKRQVDFDDLVLDVHDPVFVSVIERTLRGDDEVQTLFALELIEGLPLAPWSSALRRSFESGSVLVRKKILQLAAGEPDVLEDARVLEALSSQESVRLEAIQAVAARELTDADPILRNLLHSSSAEVQAAVATVFLDRRTTDRDLATQAMARLIGGADPRAKAAALPYLVNHPDLLPNSLLEACLRDPALQVREAALQVAAERREESLVADSVACLDDPRTAAAAQQALIRLPAERMIPYLEQTLGSEETNVRRKIGIARLLGTFPAGVSAPLLLSATPSEDLDVAAQAVRSLLLLARDGPIPSESRDAIPALAQTLLRRAYHCNRMLRLLGSPGANTLLCSDLADRMHRIVPIVLGLEMVYSQESALADAATIAEERDPAKLPLLLELLDNVLTAEKRLAIIPVVEPLSAEERDLAGRRLYSDLPAQLEPELRKAVYSQREWVSAVALDHLWRAGYRGLLETVDWERVQDSALTREVRTVIANPVTKMYSTLEKTILLKSVGLFADIPVEKLSKIAQITQETRMPKAAVVMREGEFGDSLFIVADGCVRVDKAQHNLARLRKGDCVGEMALLDHSPRSADVLVEEEATLLRIGREDFNEVTTANPEILQGIVRLLVRRLREVNDKLTNSERLANESKPSGSLERQ